MVEETNNGHVFIAKKGLLIQTTTIVCDKLLTFNLIFTNI